MNASSPGHSRTYYAAGAKDLQNARVAIGNVAGDSIDDIVIGAPNYSPPGGQSGDGAIFVIHGSTGLPADGTTLEVVAAAPTGGTVPGTLGGAAEQRGRQIHIGDYDEVPPLDLLAGHGNLMAGGIEVFVGGTVFPSEPTIVYDLALSNDLSGGSLFLADVDGTPGVDMVVGAAGAVVSGGAGLFSVIPHGAPPHTAIDSAGTFDYLGSTGQGLGASLGVFDFDDDGDLDVIIGAGGGSGGFWDVRSTPVTADFTVSGVDQRLFGPCATAGDGVIWADVNADGNNDLILTDTGCPRAFCLFGLD
jgi:hypothetical protein